MTTEDGGSQSEGAGSAGGGRAGKGTHLTYWDPEDEAFWEAEGKAIAKRNLYISIPNLLLAFCVWLVWSIIVAKIQAIHVADPSLFAFAEMGVTDNTAYRAMLFTIPAVAGLAGATLRLPNSFMIAIVGGRNTIAMTSLLLIIPMLGAGIALQDPNVSFLSLVVLATLSGVGGGAFASSMSNISFFFPRRVQGTSLGLNAGLGNLGVSVMQVVTPAAMGIGIFGALAGSPHAGIYVQNGGLIWVPALAVFMVAAWLWMNNLPNHDVGDTPKALKNYFLLEILGMVGAAAGVSLLIADWGISRSSPIYLVKILIVMLVAISVTMILLRYLTPRETRENLRNQFQIFHNKHNWIMTWLYIMTFGSFIGFSNAFPKLIADVFGFLPHGAVNPNAPDPFAYAWLGPLVGSLVRPVGGWLSDRFGGAKVTHWDTIVMILATLGVAYFIVQAKAASSPEVYFLPFLLLFLLLFVTTGIGNGSTFRMIPIIFERDQAGPVLGWTSAIAAYGAYIIPIIFGYAILLGASEWAMVGFAGYYVTCLAVNWWFYARKGAEKPC
jgi:NNP family nitrate/nitrite transporter-like MFS transporter